MRAGLSFKRLAPWWRAIYFSALVSALLSAGASSRAACLAEANGPISWWAFDGDLRDSNGLNPAVGEGNPAGQTSLTFEGGQVALALQLDGVDDRVSVASGPTLDVGAGDGMTIEGWFKPQDPGAQRPLVEWNNRRGDAGVHFWVSQGYQGVAGDLFANVMDRNGASHHVFTPGGLVTASEWYHAALTYDRARGTASIHLNGVRRATQVIGSFSPHTTYELFFGERVGAVRFTGALDEWGLYNRALADAEVRAIFDAGSEGRCKAPIPPTITRQPANQTIYVGQTTTLEVVAYGSYPLTFQWLKDEQPLPGATNALLLIASASLAASGQYAVVVTNHVGTLRSHTATLTVLELPPCFPTPSGLVSWWRFDLDVLDHAGINPGQASGLPAFGPGKVDQAVSFDGADDDVSIPAAPTLDVGRGAGMTVEGWFKPQDPFAQRPLVEWSNRQGSSGVHLWVSQSGNGDLFANLIDVNNTSHYVQSAGGLVGSSAWYHVALTYDRATGLGTIYLNGLLVAQQAMGSVSLHTSYDLFFGRRIHGGGASTWFQGAMDEWGLYLRAISASEINAIYQSGARGRCKVPIPPFITLQPVDQTLVAGDTIELRTSAIGTLPLAFQWLRGDQPLPDATNATLRILNAPLDASGNYVVVVTSAGGAVTSQVAVVSVVGLPPCVAPPSNLVGWWSFDDDTEPLAGDPVQFSGGPTIGPGRVGSALFLDGADDSCWVSAGQRADVGKKSGLTIECWIKPANVDSQQPLVEWNNRAGSLGLHFWMSQSGGGGPGSLYANLIDTTSDSHSINSPGGLLRSGEWEHVGLTYDKATGKAVLYLNGQSVAEKILGVFAAQTAPPYDLFFGQRVSTGGSAHRYTGGLDEVSLYARALSAAEMWSIYRLGASGGKCRDSLPPDIVAGPQDLIAGRGGEARFEVVTSGSRPLFYQWLFNDSALPGATAASLVLSNIVPSHAGRYSVIVSNLSGQVTSPNATLVVKPPPTVVQAGQAAAPPGTKALVPLTAVVQGSEHSLAFSLTFDSAKLAFAEATLATSIPAGTTLVLSTNDAGLGKVGLRIALPAGASWPAGTQVLAQVQFVIALSATDPSLAVSFGDQPLPKQIREESGETLLATFVPGEVLVILPRVRVVSLDVAAADTMEVPIELTATGSENALGFSLQFDTRQLTFIDASLGPAAPADSSLILNTNAAPQGRVGLGIGLPPNTTVPVGTARLLTVRFRVGLFLSPTTVPIQMTDTPTPRQVSDQLAGRLQAVFSGGTLRVVSFEFEGDVSPRPGGDRSVGVTDWTQTGRYAGAFDVPTAEEFARADCAPLESKGNGQISIADWVQTGRFYAGLDTVTARGGPSVPVTPPQGGGNLRAAAADRSVRLLDQRVVPGAAFVVPISLNAQGDENAFGFSVQFDPAVLEFVGYTNGPELAQTILSVNPTGVAEGKLGVTMALQLGTAIARGDWQLLHLSFRARIGVEGVTGISFIDQPVLREVVDVRARTLSANFVGGTVSFGPLVVIGPRLDLVRSGPNLIFLWPVSSTNFDLEMSSQLAAPNWIKVGIAPVPVGGQNIVSLGMTNAQQYFRLRHP